MFVLYSENNLITAHVLFNPADTNSFYMIVSSKIQLSLEMNYKLFCALFSTLGLFHPHGITIVESKDFHMFYVI